jgi:hypothetical protein
MTKLLVVFAFLVFAVSARASDGSLEVDVTSNSGAVVPPKLEHSFDNNYLTPAQYDEFDQSAYDQALRTGFADIVGPDVVLRSVGLPGLVFFNANEEALRAVGLPGLASLETSEYAFAMRRNGDSYVGVYYLYPTSLWYASPGGVPTGEISPYRWECTISDLRAAQIVEVWTRVLQNMPANAGQSGYTDTSIHWFVLNIEDQVLRGMTWSPDPGTVPRQMIELTENLANYCRMSNWWLGSIISERFGRAADIQVEQILSRLPDPRP